MSSLVRIDALSATRHVRLLAGCLAVCLAGAVIGMLVVLAILHGSPPGQSIIFNLPWARSFAAAMAQGSVYPRFLPDLWAGIGGLDFYFYAPLPFLMTAAVSFVAGVDASRAMAVAGLLMLLASGATFWPLARRYLDAMPAVIAALAYMAMPYHVAVDLVIRQSMGEVAAYIFWPLAITGVLKVTDGDRGGLLILFGVSGLVLSHLPSAVLAAIVLSVIILCRAVAIALSAALSASDGVKAVRPWLSIWARKCGSLAFWALLGLGVTAVYWLPALSLLPRVSADILYGPYYQATSWLFLDGRAPPNAAMEALTLGCLIGGIACCAASVYVSRHRPDVPIIAIGVPAVVTLFMMSGLSMPIWQHTPVSSVQFPFRLLLFLDAAAALALGVLVQGAVARHGRARLALAACIGVLVICGIQPVHNASKTIRATGQTVAGETMQGAPEYLPVPARQALDTATAGMDAGEGMSRKGHHYAAVIERWKSDRAIAAQLVTMRAVSPRAYELSGAAGQTLVPIFYWPYWQATDRQSGAAIPLTPDEETGMMRLASAPGQAGIHLELPLHWSEKAGLASLLASLLILLGALALRRLEAGR